MPRHYRQARKDRKTRSPPGSAAIANRSDAGTERWHGSCPSGLSRTDPARPKLSKKGNTPMTLRASSRRLAAALSLALAALAAPAIGQYERSDRYDDGYDDRRYDDSYDEDGRYGY